MSDTHNIIEECFRHVDLVDRLSELMPEDLSGVLRRVFERTLPPSGFYDLQYQTYFFGIAVAWKADNGKPLTEQETDWDIFAVAYPDREEYPYGMIGPGVPQEGECQHCKMELLSNAKHTICPICKTPAYLT